MVPKLTPDTLALFLLFLLLSGCGSDPTVADAVPWSGATFAAPLPTRLTVRNDRDTTLNLTLSTRHLPEFVAGSYPDTLAPGEAATVTLDLHRPADIFVRLGYNQSLRPLLPGMNRVLLLTATGMRNAGDFADHYAYLDGKLLPIRPVGRQPEETADLAAYRETLHLRYRQRVDTVRLPSPATWLTDFVDREVDLLTLKDVYGLRGYYRFFYADTLPLPDTLLRETDRLLGDRRYADNLSYGPLLYVRAYHAGEERYAELGSVGARNNRLITDFLADSLPATARRDDLIAGYVNREQTDDRSYAGKDDNLERLRQLLPPAHRSRLEGEYREWARARSSDADVLALLASPLEEPAGRMVVPLADRQQPATLYKFWFDGCYPCIVQQPHEQALLDRFPELELVYVAFRTDRDRWLPYLAKHEPPTDRQLYLAPEREKLLTAAIGQLGAPTYLLLGRNDAVLCRHCPKPDDPLLAELIAGAVTLGE